MNEIRRSEIIRCLEMLEYNSKFDVIKNNGIVYVIYYNDDCSSRHEFTRDVQYCIKDLLSEEEYNSTIVLPKSVFGRNYYHDDVKDIVREDNYTLCREVDIDISIDDTTLQRIINDIIIRLKECNDDKEISDLLFSGMETIAKSLKIQ